MVMAENSPYVFGPRNRATNIEKTDAINWPPSCSISVQKTDTIERFLKFIIFYAIKKININRVVFFVNLDIRL